MDAHRIEVFNRADDHHVVGQVAHHLQLKFLPAQHRFFDQHFVHRAEVEPAADNVVELFRVESQAAAGAAQRERRPHHRRVTDLLGERPRFCQRVHQRAARRLEPAVGDRLFEPEPVFGDLDGAQRSADQLHPVLFQRTRLGQLDRQVQRGLPTHRGQQRVGTFGDDDGFHVFGRQRLDVGAVGDFRVGHDGGGVGVDQHDSVAFALERLAGLRAGVVELARLPDHNRPRADDENLFDVGPLRHSVPQTRPDPKFSSQARLTVIPSASLPAPACGRQARNLLVPRPLPTLALVTPIPPLCHPERQRGICLLFAPTDPYQSAAKSSQAGLALLISATLFSRRQA